MARPRRGLGRALGAVVLWGLSVAIHVAPLLVTSAYAQAVCGGTSNPEGQTCTLSGATLDVHSATYTNAGTFNNATGGSFNVYSGTLENTGSFNNEWRVGLFVATLVNSGTFNNTGLTSVFRSTLVNEAGGTFNLDAGSLIDVTRRFTVENHGTFNAWGEIASLGDFVLPIVFNNHGVLNIGPTPLWLASGTLTNSGTISPGGAGVLGTASISGYLTQTAAGQLLVDVDWASGAADTLDVTGTDGLAGTVVVNPLNLSAVPGLSRTFQILRRIQNFGDDGIEVKDTAAVDYELVINPTTIDLVATIDLAGVEAGGMTRNQTSVGQTLNGIVGQGGTLGFIPVLLTLPTSGELGDALDQLAPQAEGGANASMLASGSTFAGQLLSCRMAGEEGDANAYIREGQCLWARSSVRRMENDGGEGEVGFDETSTFYSAGAQVDLGGPWRLGAGLGFERSDLDTSGNATSEAERLHLGAVVKYNPGPWLVAASLTGGHGWHDNERYVAFAGFDETATSESRSSFLAGRLTAAYLASFGAWYAKPQIDVAVTHLERGAYREDAAGGIALDVAKSDDTVVSVSPALELGAQLRLGPGGIARPYLKAGMTWLDTGRFTTTAEFADAPAGSAPFQITSEIDDVMADLGTGVDLIATDGTVLRLQYDGRLGDETTQHGGSAKVSVPF